MPLLLRGSGRSLLAHAGVPSARLALAALAIVLLLAACGGGGGDSPTTPTTPTTPTPPTTPTTPTPTPGFTMTASAPVPASIAQGDSALITITLHRTGGFAGSVQLSLENVASQLTPTWSATRLERTASTATVSLVASMLTTPGAYSIVVRADADGQTTRTDTVSLAVTVRPTGLTLTRDGSTLLSTARGGLPITFGLLAVRDGVLGDLSFDVVDPLPRGVTVSFDPPTTPGGSTTVSLRADTTTAPATYSTTFRVRGPDSAPTGTLPVAYTILPDARITLAVDASTLSVVQNGNGGVALTITRENFTQVVALETTGQPAGVTVSYEQLTSANGNQRYTVRFTAEASVVPGSYPVTVTGRSSGAPASTVGVTLVITAAPTGGDIVFAFCGPAANRPIWFGTGRSGRGFTRRLPESGDRYAFSLTDRTADVAWVTQHGPDDFHISVVTGTPAEIRDFGATRCVDVTGRTVTGSVAGLAADDVGVVAVGPRIAAPAPSASVPSFTVADVPLGAVDVVAARLRAMTSPATLLADRVFVQRAVNPAGNSLGTLDLAAALAPDTMRLTIGGAQAGDLITASSAVMSSHGTALLLSTSSSTNLEHSARALPASVRIAGELHQLSGASARSSGSESVWQSVTRTVATPASVALSLGETPAVPQVVLYESDGVFARYSAQFLEQVDYARLFSVTFSQEAGVTRRAMVLTGTAAGVVTVGNPDQRRLRAPEFAGASGWNPLWEPRAALPLAWTTSAFGWDGAGTIAPALADGVTTRSYRRSGLLSAP